MKQYRICQSYLLLQLAKNIVYMSILSFIFAWQAGKVGWMAHVIDNLDNAALKNAGSGFNSLVFIITIVIGTGVVAYSFFWQKSFVYMIDDSKVNLTGGIFNTIDRSISFSKVTDVALTQSLLGQLFEYASLSFQTAGTGVLNAEVVFSGISIVDAQGIKNDYYGKIEATRI